MVILWRQTIIHPRFGRIAFFAVQHQQWIKIRWPKDPEFDKVLALNCTEGSKRSLAPSSVSPRESTLLARASAGETSLSLI